MRYNDTAMPESRTRPSPDHLLAAIQDQEQQAARGKLLIFLGYAAGVGKTYAMLLAAQQRQAEINGPNRTYFCGAYWRYGFHEDGVVSALNALEHFKRTTHHAELPLPRTDTASAV